MKNIPLKIPTSRGGLLGLAASSSDAIFQLHWPATPTYQTNSMQLLTKAEIEFLKAGMLYIAGPALEIMRLF